MPYHCFRYNNCKPDATTLSHHSIAIITYIAYLRNDNVNPRVPMPSTGLGWALERSYEYHVACLDSLPPDWVPLSK